MITARPIQGVQLGNSRGVSGNFNLLPDPLAALTFYGRFQTNAGFGATPLAPLGLYKDTACTTPATVAGDLVAAWRDELSGSGLTLTQSTSGKRPVLQFTGGKPVLRFNGQNNSTCSCFDCPLSFVSTSHIWYAGVTQNANTGRVLFDSSTGRLILYPYSDPIGSKVGWYDGAFRSIDTGTTPKQVLTYRFDGGGVTGTVYRNGTSIGSSVYVPTAIGGTTVLGAINDQGGGGFDGDISSFVVQSSLPTTPQQQLIEGFLATI